MLKAREPFTNLLTQGMVIKDGAKMSKSKGNVVDPDEIINRWGADTARLFILFASPPEKDLDWSDQGVEGAHRFLQRVWRLVETNLDGLKGASESPVPTSVIEEKRARELKRRIHYTIKSVTRDIQVEKQFNTAIARLMELSNALGVFDKNTAAEWILFREGVEVLLTCLTPIAPHLCEELWSMMGNEGFISLRSWPSFEEKALESETVTVVLQINGKVREQMDLPAGLDPEEMRQMILADPAVKSRLEGKEIIRVITVPDKLINVVVKG